MGPAGPAGVFVDPSTAIVTASNIFVDIQGICGGALPGLALSRIGLDIAVRELTTGADWDYRVYGPGDVTYPQVTLRIDPSCWSEAYVWWLDAASGKNIRKSVTVHVTNWTTGDTDMTITMSDAFPLSFDPNDGTLVVKPVRIEATGGPGQVAALYAVAPTHAYTVESFDGIHVMSASQVSGGAVVIEVADASAGSDQFHTPTPGHKYITPLSARLHGAASDVFEWANDTAAGRPWKRTLHLAPNGGSRVLTYLDAFPVSVTYINPLVPLIDGHMPAVVDITVQPIRLEIQ